MDRILIIGGTNFIGRNLIEKLSVNKKYDLTIFNRGITNPDLFPNIKKIIGDRNSHDVKLIHQINWDYIIDLSCYFPQSLINILRELPLNLKKYIFISTCSVYQDEKVTLCNENALIKNCNQDQFDDQSTKSYGNRKAECERIIQSSKFNFTVLRPDLVYGKYDHSDRFYYWLHQEKKYNKILVPNNGTSLFSLTYVNDLVNTIEKTIVEKPDRDIYNITTTTQTSIGQILDYTLEIMANKPKLVNANSRYLKSNKINEWTDMPLWIDSDHSTFENKKILDNYSLKFTNFKTSVRETIQHYNFLGWPTPNYGIDREKQISLIEKIVN
jgi:2'-hydroxyisoflavone reductase